MDILGIRNVFTLAVVMSATSVIRSQDAVQMYGSDHQFAQPAYQISDVDYYNLKAGPVSLRFDADLWSEFSDNVNYANTDRSSDLYFEPSANMHAYWPVTVDNSIYFNTGIGYVAYLRHTELDHLNINPDSQLAFQLYIGEVTLNFHDRFSMSDDITQSPTVSGSGDFVQAENVVGADAQWSLNQLVLTFGYDHDWVTYLSSGFNTSDHNSDFVYSRAALTNGLTTIGAELGTGITYYDQNILSDNTQVNGGLFAGRQLTQHISATAGVGAAAYFFSSSTSLPRSSDVVSYYAHLDLNHQVNNWFSHSLSGGRRLEEDTFVNLLELYFVNYTATATAIRGLPISLQLTYEHGKEDGGIGEKFDRYGLATNVKYQITDRLTGTFAYSIWDKNSSISANSYLVNSVGLDLSYSF